MPLIALLSELVNISCLPFRRIPTLLGVLIIACVSKEGYLMNVGGGAHFQNACHQREMVLLEEQ